MTKTEILRRIRKVNKQLIKRGATIEQMKEFWKECFAECGKQLKLKL